MRRITGPIAVFAVLLFASSFLAAQNVPASGNNAGWYGSLNLGVSHDEDGWNNEFGSTFGYDIDKQWAVESGMPLYFVAPSSSATTTTATGTTTTSNSYAALGDAFVRVKFDPHWNVVRYNTSLTGTAPTGSREHGISSGHATWNWGNKVEKDFWRVTPYVQASLANSLANSMSFQRAFTTYGFISEQKAGVSFDLVKGVSLEASYYNDAPLADQTVYSRLINRGKGNSNAAVSSQGKGHNRVFENNAVTSGNGIAKDHGFGAGISANPMKRIEWSVDYNRSAAYQTNTISTSFGYRFGHPASSRR